MASDVGLSIMGISIQAAAHLTETGKALSQASLARRLCMSTSKALNTNPLTIRIDLDSE